jgi:hypothetical protein
MSVDTGAGTYYGTTGGLWSPSAGQFTPAGYAAKGFTPSEASEFISVPETGPDGQPTGRTKLVPRGAVFGTGVPGGGGGGGGVSIGGGGGGGGGGGTGGAPATPAGPPPGSNVQPGQPMSQKDADLANFAQRESGNQNIYSNVKVPGYTKEQTGSGYYQIIPSTWAEGQALAGIPPNQRTATAIEASPQQQYQVAGALYDKYGGRPWAQSAPGGAGRGGGGGGGPPAQGPFIGATTAQPVGGGGGMQYLPASPGGGGGIPGVQRGPGGAPILTPPSPYQQKQFEQGATDFTNDQQLDRALPQRTAPLLQIESILQSNKSVQTGPKQAEINDLQTSLRALGMDVGSVQNITDYQSLVKLMAQNARGLPGANASDLARIEANASTMSPMQLRETIQELTAKQLGAERMRSAQFRQFASQYPNTAAAMADSQNYNAKTAGWMANQDPVAYAIDALPAAARVQYFNSLKGPARDRFIASYRNAQRLFGVDMQNAPQ